MTKDMLDVKCSLIMYFCCICNFAINLHESSNEALIQWRNIWINWQNDTEHGTEREIYEKVSVYENSNKALIQLC